jgi:hypothetical protein
LHAIQQHNTDVPRWRCVRSLFGADRRFLTGAKTISCSFIATVVLLLPTVGTCVAGIVQVARLCATCVATVLAAKHARMRSGAGCLTGTVLARILLHRTAVSQHGSFHNSLLVQQHGEQLIARAAGRRSHLSRVTGAPASESPKLPRVSRGCIRSASLRPLDCGSCAMATRRRHSPARQPAVAGSTGRVSNRSQAVRHSPAASCAPN